VVPNQTIAVVPNQTIVLNPNDFADDWPSTTQPTPVYCPTSLFVSDCLTVSTLVAPDRGHAAPARVDVHALTFGTSAVSMFPDEDPRGT
jgi:hypothetical protein